MNVFAFYDERYVGEKQVFWYSTGRIAIDKQIMDNFAPNSFKKMDSCGKIAQLLDICAVFRYCSTDYAR
jgi:hypothetical protein